MKNPNNSFVLFKAKSMGSIARELCSRGIEGTVLASVTDTIYLESGTGELFWIAGESDPFHRRCICVWGKVPKIQKGAKFSVKPDQIVFADIMKIDLSEASGWQAKTPGNLHLSSITSIYPKTRDIYTELAKIPGSGFGRLISAMLEILSDPSGGIGQDVQDPILRRAWTSIQEIVLESGRHNFNSILEKAEKLSGLGAGLTPSGDDFIGGLFFAFHFLSNAFPDYLKFPESYFERFLERKKKKTNLISFTLMQDMSAGHGLAPLHEFVNFMFTDQPNDLIVASALELANVGSSTGWDILTGVFAGLISTRSYSKECQ